jgi:predicted  nucleic acid-binding Zn-ribbon protein
MDNIEIKRAQLRQRDAQREVKELTTAVQKKTQELEQLELALIESKRALKELDELLEGKEYKPNT